MTKKKQKRKVIKNLSITKIGYGGWGIASLPDNKKVLVGGGVIPGMVVDAHITKKKKDYLEAQAFHVQNQESIKELCNPICPHCWIPFLENRRFVENENLESKTKATCCVQEGESKEESITEGDKTLAQKGCGGCKRQHIPYVTQCDLKVKILSDSFRNCSHVFNAATIHDILPSPQQLHYRNKIEFSFGKYVDKVENEKGKEEVISQDWNLGFHKQGHFSKVIDIEQCYLISPRMHEVFSYLKSVCKNSGMPVYDQKAHTGFFRHLVIREGTNTKQMLVNLVVATKRLETQEDALLPKNENVSTCTKHELYERFLKTLREDERLRSRVQTCCITENNGLADVVKNQDVKVKVLRGDGYIYETLYLKTTNEEENTAGCICDGNNEAQQKNHVMLQFRISPFSFFQTNTKGAEILFATASKRVGEVKGTILDLYCGTGSIGLSFLAQGKGDFVIGIEMNEDAITDARYNAQLNKLENRTYFTVGKVENIIQTDVYIQKKIPTIGLIIVDPPREGLHKSVVAFLCNLKQHHSCKLLYISCNPVTMARDVDLLVKGGWKLETFQPVDMFPQTYHVETIGVLK